MTRIGATEVLSADDEVESLSGRLPAAAALPPVDDCLPLAAGAFFFGAFFLRAFGIDPLLADLAN